MRDWIRTADRLPEPHVSVSAHSPAPYRPRDPLHHAELFVAKTDDLRGMESIAEVGPAMRDDEALANACLFEVAPEMLDLLEHWMGLVDGGPMGITSATEHLDRDTCYCPSHPRQVREQRPRGHRGLGTDDGWRS